MTTKEDVQVAPEELVTEIAKEEAIPEMTPEEKLAFRRSSMLADMMVSFRQDLESIDMNMERLAVNKKFWQRRIVETKDKDKESYEKAEASLMNITKQEDELKLATKETTHFMSFLDEVMKGEVAIEYGS